MGNKPRLLALAGPTASGKSETAVEIALRIDAEIVSADSVQVYRRFDIGSAKPGPELTSRVPHHLIDMVDPEEEYTLARFVADATATIDDIVARGKVPLVVGGTGLYLTSLIEGYTGGVTVSPEAEATIDAIEATHGLVGLAEEARRLDPERAAVVHPNDRYRLRRIVGVSLTAGKPMSAVLAETGSTGRAWESTLLWLAPPRPLLRRRIERRTVAMMEKGWREEVGRLVASGYNDDVKPMRSLGYRTLYAERIGAIPQEESVSTIVRETKAFAKRQVTWFARMADAFPIPTGADDTPPHLADRILAETDLRPFVEGRRYG